MSRPLIIVESATKARTIARYLGNGYRVESSQGHIRDLPNKPEQIPDGYKGKPWAKKWGVDVGGDFEPIYIVLPESRKTVQKLKRRLAAASELLLATDQDREGEAIAWHLEQVLKPNVPMRRMVFHEITPAAIRRALEETRSIDSDLVDAQEARRILDRLVGYGVSPVLWKKIKGGKAAGRVQSPAVRLLVERERRRIAFRPAGYWSVDGQFTTTADETFTAKLVAVDGVRPAEGKDFNEQGILEKPDKVNCLDESAAEGLVERIGGGRYTVRSVVSKPYTRNPKAPFRTSTLQQEASNKHRFGAARTMRAAQKLYENGHITYMRTDSTKLAETALQTARSEIKRRYGHEYLAAEPKQYANKVKNAQEAHEAIRPAGDSWKTPQELAKLLNDDKDHRDQQRIYTLIWSRTLASQMAPAHELRTSIRLGGTTKGGRDIEFGASGRTVTFPGFLIVYSDDVNERYLPSLKSDDQVLPHDVTATGHTTKPPGRFSEASLIKELEKRGIGRPSTYAPTIAKIIKHDYVFKKGKALVPSFTGFATTQLLEDHFEDLVDYGFTARMEDDLDRIARGEEDKESWLWRFFHGNGAPGLQHLVADDQIAKIDPRLIFFEIGKDPDGEKVVARVGKYGPYIARGNDTATVPKYLPPDELTIDTALRLLTLPRQVGIHPDTGQMIWAHNGRYGPYLKICGKYRNLNDWRLLFDIRLDEAVELMNTPKPGENSDDWLAPYTEWEPEGPVPDPSTARKKHLMDLLVSVARCEGPVVAIRAYRLIDRASCSKALKKPAKSALNRASADAVRKGSLIATDLFGGQPWQAHVLHVPSAPGTILSRKRGPRRPDELPPEEIVEMMKHLIKQGAPSDPKTLKQLVVKKLRLGRLAKKPTQKLNAFLDRCIVALNS